MRKSWGEEAFEPSLAMSRTRLVKQSLLICLLLFLLFSLLPYFDYHRLLPPLPEAVEMSCHMSLLEPLPQRIVEAELLVGFIDGQPMKLFLYATVLRRHTECHYKRGGDQRQREYLYTGTFVNISGVDIAQLMRRMEEQYHDSYSMWNYGEFPHRILRNYSFDEHGLSPSPIDPYEDFLPIYLLVKFLLLLSTGILSALLFLLRMAVMRIFPQPKWVDVV
jgi:hypothetical protein